MYVILLTVKCGRNVAVNVVTGTTYIIESPNYPNRYPNNAKCLWNVRVSTL